MSFQVENGAILRAETAYNNRDLLQSHKINRVTPHLFAAALIHAAKILRQN